MATVSLKTIAPSGQSGDYSSLNAWEAGEQADLTGADLIAIGCVSGNWNGIWDSTDVMIDGWETGPSNYISLFTTGEAQHSGIFSLSKYTLISLTCYENNLNLDHFQIYNTGTGLTLYGSFFFVTGSNTGNFLYSNNITSGRGIRYGARWTSTPQVPIVCRIFNNLIFDISGGVGNDSTAFLFGSGTYYIDNNTVANTLYGYWAYQGNPIYANNNLGLNCSGECFRVWNTVTTSNNNASSDATADDKDGVGNRINQNFLFVDQQNGNYCLSPYDTGAILNGTGLSSQFTTDIAGINRGTGAVWDIGASHSTSYIRAIKPTGQSGNYSSLSAWEAAEQRDLTLVNKSSIAEIDGDWSGVQDTSTLTIDGWTTNSNCGIEIRAVNAATHSGVFNPIKYTLQRANSECIRVAEEYVKIYGLQLFVSSTNDIDQCCINIWYLDTGGSIFIDRCIFKGVTNSLFNYHAAIQLYEGHSGTLTVTNSIFSHFSGTFASVGGAYKYGPWNFNVYNCTAYDCKRGYFNNGGGGTFLVKNCLAQSCGDGFTGTFVTSSSNNCSNIPSDVPGLNRITGTVLFIDVSNDDFRLSPYDTGAILRGTGLSSLFNTDIVGNSRGMGNQWDIGAHHATECIRTIKPAGQSGHYSTLTSWDAANNQDLVSANRIFKAEIDGNWTGQKDRWVEVDGWTTDASHYIHIYTTATARHSGMWSENSYIITGSSVDLLMCYEDNCRIEGLQTFYTCTGRTYDYGIMIYTGVAGQIVVDSCIIKGLFTGMGGNNYGLRIAGTTGAIVKVSNCLAYNYKYVSGGTGAYLIGFGGNSAGAKSYFYNCAAINCETGFYRENGDLLCQNCYTLGCNDGFKGTFSGTSSYNLSDISGDAPGTNRITGTVLLMNSGAEDFRLSPYDTGATFRGMGLSSLFTGDILGIDRGTGNVWDLGPFHSTSVIRTIKPTGQSGHYATLNAWEAGQNRDLTLVNKSSIAEIDGNWSGVSDSTLVDINGWTTSSNNYIQILAKNSARHSGAWSDNFYKFSSSSLATPGIQIHEDYTVVSGLQLFLTPIDFSGANSRHSLIRSYSNFVVIDSCIGKGAGTVSIPNGTYITLFYTYSSNVTGICQNCIAYDIRDPSGFGLGFAGASDANQTKIKAYNCTAYNCGMGFWSVGALNILAQNCLAQNCQDGFKGTFETSSSNNCSNITGDIPGINRMTGNVIFLDTGNGDFRLSPYDTGAKGRGTDLSALFITDAAGRIRTVPWDIGALMPFDFGAPVYGTYLLLGAPYGFYSVNGQLALF